MTQSGQANTSQRSSATKLSITICRTPGRRAAVTYVGIQASRRVGYDFGVMYFSNRKDVPFSEIIPQYRAGNIDKSYLADRIPYETGGLLCLLMDELEVPGWQETLNNQTLDAPVSLYSMLKDWVEG